MALDYNNIEDLKYNPFTGDYNYTTITDESHVIPAAPVNGAYMIRLYHAPRETIPSGVSITIGGNPLTEVSSAPSNMQFRVCYDERGRGWVEFNSNQAGDTALISYSAYGTLMTTQTLQAIYNAFYMRPLIYGLSITNNGTDSANDIDFGNGWAFNMAESQRVQLSAMTKRLDATFVAGTGNGMLDTGSKAGSTNYYIYLIGKNTDLSAGDILASTNATTPTLPAGWTNYTKIGIIQTDLGGSILQGKWHRNGESITFIYSGFIALYTYQQIATTDRFLVTSAAPPGSKIKINCEVDCGTTSYIMYGETHIQDSPPSNYTNSRCVIFAGTDRNINEVIYLDASNQFFMRGSRTDIWMYIKELSWEIAL